MTRNCDVWEWCTLPLAARGDGKFRCRGSGGPTREVMLRIGSWLCPRKFFQRFGFDFCSLCGVELWLSRCMFVGTTYTGLVTFGRFSKGFILYRYRQFGINDSGSQSMHNNQTICQRRLISFDARQTRRRCHSGRLDACWPLTGAASH